MSNFALVGTKYLKQNETKTSFISNAKIVILD
jgi:hypothetical protein